MNFIEEFFSLNLNQFENFGVNFPIGAFLLIFSVAMCAAIFIYNYQKRCTGLILKQLVRHNATNAESAKTLKELHLETNFYLKAALSRGGMLTHLVKSANSETPTYEEYVSNSKKRGYKEAKIDFKEAKFYIPEEQKAKAKRLVEGSGGEWLKSAISAAVIILVLVILMLFLPDILDAVNASSK